MTTHVPSYWPPSPGPLAFLVEAPGDKEVDAEERARARGTASLGPLAGKSGWRHELICEAVGLERSTCYHGHVFSFQLPRHNGKNDNLAGITVNLPEYRKLAADTAQTASTRYRRRLLETCSMPIGGRYLPPQFWPELVRCWEELDRLAAMGTRVVVLYGETALWAVLGKSGVKKNRGHILRTGFGRDVPGTGFGELLAVATYHPAASFKQQTALALIVEDVQKALSVAQNRPAQRSSFAEPIVLVPETLKDVEDALNTWVRPFRMRAWDIETTYPREGVEYEVRSVQVCADGVHAVVVPFFWEYDKTQFYKPQEALAIRALLAELLTDPAATNVWHKGQFDRSVLLGELGIPARVSEDTLLMLHADNPSDPKDLSSGAARWLQVAAWKDAGRAYD